MIDITFENEPKLNLDNNVSKIFVPSIEVTTNQEDINTQRDVTITFNLNKEQRLKINLYLNDAKYLAEAINTAVG